MKELLKRMVFSAVAGTMLLTLGASLVGVIHLAMAFSDLYLLLIPGIFALGGAFTWMLEKLENAWFS